MTANPLLRRGSDITSQPNLYERFALRDNPFPRSSTVNPLSSDPRENGEIYCEALRLYEQTQFERLLVPSPNRPDTRLMAFLMDYATRRGRGIGKTAFLTHQRRRIMSDLGYELTGGSYVVMAAHLVPEGGGKTRKFWQFVRLIAKSLNDDNCISTAIQRLRAFSGVIPQDVLTQIDQNNLAETLGYDRWLESHNVNPMFVLNPAVEQMLVSAGVSAALAKTLSRDGHSPSEFEQRFLREQSDPWWRQEGYNFVFNVLPQLFQAAGISRVLLLVDEVEKMVTPQNRYERTAFVDDVRRYFVDGAYFGVHNRTFGVLWTIHPYVQELWQPYWYSAGLDRVCPIGGGTSQEFTVYFKPMKPDEAAIPLVREYMNHYRSDQSARDSLTPFTDRAVIVALEKSGGLPGPMLTLLRIALERAVEDGWTQIDEAQIESIFSSMPPSEPDELDDTPETLPPPLTDLQGEG
jgi:hypothetical protein